MILKMCSYFAELLSISALFNCDLIIIIYKIQMLGFVSLCHLLLFNIANEMEESCLSLGLEAC